MTELAGLASEKADVLIEAMKWIRLAADQGLEEALSVLENGD